MTRPPPFGRVTFTSTPSTSVCTSENPVEYVYDEFTQCEVSDKIGNTFANYLRAFLRHDPEVIMVGEIRDEETAEMALRAAQTGHLVLSTLHTNDAIGSIPRLLDLKVKANLITSCLLGVLSQRRVRKICPNCKEPYVPATDLLKEFFDQPPVGIRWYKGRGCSHCNSTGYKGRMVVAELWVPSDEGDILINKAAPFDEIKLNSYKSTLLMAEDVWRIGIPNACASPPRRGGGNSLAPWWQSLCRTVLVPAPHLLPADVAFGPGLDQVVRNGNRRWHTQVRMVTLQR